MKKFKRKKFGQLFSRMVMNQAKHHTKPTYIFCLSLWCETPSHDEYELGLIWLDAWTVFQDIWTELTETVI